jgi:hypothetical protein
MPQNLKRKGVPVLAYLPGSMAKTPLSCSFNVKFCQDSMRATISLRFTFFVDGLDVEQVFTLIYDADNLVPDETSLSDGANVSIPLQRLHATSKQGKPQWKTLSLFLKKPCGINGPSYTPILPHKSRPTFDNRFVQFTQATEADVTIDFHAFHHPNDHTLVGIISHLRRYTGGQTAAFQHLQPTIGLEFRCAGEDPPPSYVDASDMQRITKCPEQGEIF